LETLRASLDTASPDVRAELTEEWQFREAAIDPGPLLALESMLPARLPHAFHAYLTIGYFTTIEAHEFLLPSVREPDALANARIFLLTEEMWPLGLMQFGHGPCGDPLCFDFASGLPSADHPIYVFNHDLAPREAWSSRAALRPYGELVATSFGALLKGLCFADAGSPPWGVDHASRSS
jgi:hypothetical protein